MDIFLLIKIAAMGLACISRGGTSKPGPRNSGENTYLTPAFAFIQSSVPPVVGSVTFQSEVGNSRVKKNNLLVIWKQLFGRKESR